MIPRDNPIPALLDFILAWVPDLAPKHRIEASLIPKFVPRPLRAIYELAGNWPVPYAEQYRQPKWIPGLFGAQDQLLPIDRLEVRGEHLTFLRENQDVWSCETLVEREDPPVFSNSLAHDTGPGNMPEICPSLSHFLTTFCLQELTFGSRHLFEVDSAVGAPEHLVIADLLPLWEKGVYVSKEPSHSFYLCNSRVIIMNAWGDYWIAYNDEAASDLINRDTNEGYPVL